MQLPHTSNNLIFWLDTSEKFITFKKGTSTLSSIVERQSGLSCFSDPGAIPAWTRSAINGLPALNFNGAENLYFNFNSKVVSTGINIPTALMFVARNKSFPASGESLINIGSQVDGYSGLFAGPIANAPNGFLFSRSDDLANTDLGGTIDSDLNWHLYTVIYDGLNIILRVDGVQKLSAVCSLTQGNTVTEDQMAFGDYNQSSIPIFGHLYWTGDLATAVVYAGKNGKIDLSAEDYFLKLYNI